MSSKRITYKVQGRVQGVNFRAFTQRQAEDAGVTGWVKNGSDGTVQGEAQGTDEKIKEFIKDLNRGPPAAKVESVSTSDIDTKEGESGFSV
ncbi:MAG: hypothetical protein M1820_009066 [Bogoriella megaspora]|nr:MAG: hypothetical protein M1820_009066 [Bogoriella megaspora]